MNAFLSLAFISSLVTAGPPEASPSPSNWPTVTAAARDYLAAPGDATARSLIRALPNEQGPPPRDVAELLWSLLDTIERRGRAGDFTAIQLGFRLQDFADAAISEDLAVCLGSIATARPTAFLHTLASVRPTRDPASDPLEVVRWFDPDLTEPQRASELQKRLNALRSVQDPRLRSLRDACIARLTAVSANDR